MRVQKTNITIYLIDKPECLCTVKYREDISILEHTQVFYFGG